MKYRKMAGLLCAAMMLSAMPVQAADTGKEAEAGDEAAASCDVTEISFWHYYNDEQNNMLEHYVKEFNDTVGKEKAIHVTSVSKGSIDDVLSDIERVLDSTNMQDEAPDIFLAYRDILRELMKKDAVEALDDYFTEEEQAAYVKDYLDEGILDEHLYIVPFVKSTEVLTMNLNTEFEQFLSDNGLSADTCFSDWETMTDTAKSYYEWTDAQTDTENDGKAMMGVDVTANLYNSMYHQLGGEIYTYDEAGNPVFDVNEENLRAIYDSYYVPYVQGYFAKYGKYRSDDVKQGLLAGYVGSLSSISYFPENCFDMQGNEADTALRVYEVPCLKDGEKTNIQQGAGIAMLKSTPEKEAAAAEFMKWVSITENVALATDMAYLPAINNVDNTAVNNIESNAAKDALKIGIETTKDCHMVYGFDFDNAYAVRRNLESYIDEFCESGKTAYQSLIGSGMSEDDAIKAIATDDNFQKWYDGIKAVFEG